MSVAGQALLSSHELRLSSDFAFSVLKASRLLETACDDDQAAACTELGRLYRDGETEIVLAHKDVSYRDLNHAVELFDRGCRVSYPFVIF